MKLALAAVSISVGPNTVIQLATTEISTNVNEFPHGKPNPLLIDTGTNVGLYPFRRFLLVRLTVCNPTYYVPLPPSNHLNLDDLRTYPAISYYYSNSSTLQVRQTFNVKSTIT